MDTFVQVVSAALVSPVVPKSAATRVVSTAALAVPAALGAPRCSFTCHDVGRVGNATSVIIHTGMLLTAQLPKSAMLYSYRFGVNAVISANRLRPVTPAAGLAGSSASLSAWGTTTPCFSAIAMVILAVISASTSASRLVVDCPFLSLIHISE